MTEMATTLELTSKHAADVLERRNEAMRVLYDTVMEAGSADECEIPSILCRNLWRLTHAQWVILGRVDSTRQSLHWYCLSTHDFQCTEIEQALPVEIDPTELDGLLVDQIIADPVPDQLQTMLQNSQLNESIGDSGNCFRITRRYSDERVAIAWLQMKPGERLRLKDIVMTYMELACMMLRRVEAEQKRQQLMKELKSVNQELKEFAHVVSHDLKAPLRGVHALTSWVLEDYQDKLGPEGCEQLELMMSRIKRMESLVEGVLHYSRVGQASRDCQAIELMALLPDVIDMIAVPDHIEIKMDHALPIIWGDRTRIHQVFQNLICNAVKYMDKPQGLIQVQCERDGDFWRFCVQDNGPGIDHKHFDHIFQLFKTVSVEESYENTGVGLSLVKRIVEMYGGKVWVESTLTEGSRFFFTLPEANPYESKRS